VESLGFRSAGKPAVVNCNRCPVIQLQRRLVPASSNSHQAVQVNLLEDSRTRMHNKAIVVHCYVWPPPVTVGPYRQPYGTREQWQ
jgi:hypothetical protein